MADLSDLLLPDIHGLWNTVFAWQAQDDWPVELWQDLRYCLLVTLGNTFRQLYKVFDAWPWKLCALYDPRKSDAERVEAAEAFLATPPCCLDIGCDRKLQQQCLG